MMSDTSDSENLPVAVYCRGLKKTLGSGSSKTDVLCGLNMTVPYGSIYGLLGASGCGKTTLLKCVVGMLKVDKGHLVTLGKAPGSKDHLVPGRRVGYMPQEIALFMLFTIGETLSFFGRIHGMSKQDIVKRTEFLITFLTLPPKSKRISDLSGGQQRRVSLAAALLQEPDLLILDEPTVGVDPVLREKIWEHLLEIAKSSLKTTIIITTHYIEEAALADKVGLMRGGRLLAENKPSILTAHYQLQNLEAVFLHLCHHDRLPNNDDDELLPSINEPCPYVLDLEDQDDQVAYNRSRAANGDKVFLLGTENRKTVYGTLNHRDSAFERLRSRPWVPWHLLPVWRNLAAVSIKDLIVMKGNIPILLFQFLIPAIQVILFCVCIGEPQGLHVSVCNDDIDELGALFLSYLHNETITQVRRKDIQTAVHDVKMGDSWCAMHLKENFSLDLLTRLTDGVHATNKTIDGSTIWLYQDMTDQQIAVTIQARVVEAFNYFAQNLISSFGYNPDVVRIPVGLKEAVYGTPQTMFTDFMAIGMIVSAIYFLAGGLTTLTFVLERKEGLLERSYVAGVSVLEIMLSHILTQVLIMIGQVLVMLAIALLIFHIPNYGNLFIASSLIIVVGMCGMTLGLAISCFTDSENGAIQAILGIMYPSLLISGTIWPIEAMPDWLKAFSLCLPLTYPTHAVRSIMGRGWGLDMTLVWSSYLISIAWSLAHSVAAALIMHFKH